MAEQDRALVWGVDAGAAHSTLPFMRRLPLFAVAALLAAVLASCATSLGTPTAPTETIRAPVALLIGRFSSPWHKPEISHQLRERGFDVRSKMSKDVDTVFIGNDPINEQGDAFVPVASLPDYQAAIAQNAKIILWRDVRMDFAPAK